MEDPLHTMARYVVLQHTQMKWDLGWGSIAGKLSGKRLAHFIVTSSGLTISDTAAAQQQDADRVKLLFCFAT